jgi:hypothetical protein
MFNEILGEIAKLKTPYDMWIYLRCPTDAIQPHSISLRFDLLCALNNQSVWQKYHSRSLYRPLQLNGFGLPIYRNPSPPAHLSIVKS